MSYTKHNFKNGDTLYAEQLNAIEDEITKITEVDTVGMQQKISHVSESIAEILDRLKSGKIEDAELHLGFYLDENGDLCQKEVE